MAGNVNTCTVEKLFKCDTCGKRFLCNNGLIQHDRIHTVIYVVHNSHEVVV